MITGRTLIIVIGCVGLVFLSCRNQKTAGNASSDTSSDSATDSEQRTVDHQQGTGTETQLTHGGTDLSADDSVTHEEQEDPLDSDDTVKEDTDDDGPAVNPDTESDDTDTTSGLGVDERVPLPEECEAEFLVLDSNKCDMALKCGEEIPLTAVTCVETGVDELRCTCDSSYSNREFIISRLSLADGCAYMADVCGHSELPEPTEDLDWDCAPYVITNDETTCHAEQVCEVPIEAPTNAETTADWTLMRSADCWLEGGDTWVCDCTRTWASLQLEFESTSDAATVCSDAMTMCLQSHMLQPTSEIECRTASQSVNDVTCESDINCTQEGTFGGIQVSLSGWSRNYCHKESKDSMQWDCQCTTKNEVSTFEFTEEDSDPWITCTRAAERCQEEYIINYEAVSSMDPTYFGDYF